MASARPYPPSAQRIAEARQSGHLPRPVLVATASAAVAVITLGFLFGERALRALTSAFVDAVTAVARGDAELAYALAHEAMARASFGAACALALVLVVVLTTQALGRGLTLRGRGGRGIRFAALRPSRTGAALWALGLVLSTALALDDVIALEPHGVAELAGDFARRVLLLALACSLVDVAFARARFFRSLWMTRAEMKDEQRALFGAPELRALRSSRLREGAGSAPASSTGARSDSSPSAEGV